MSLLSKSNKVLFVCEPTYIGDIGIFPKRTRSSTGVARISENLYAYVPPSWLPITYGYPRLNRLLERGRGWKLRREMDHLQMKRPILYIWHPSFVHMVGRFEEALVVYHIYDEYLSFRASESDRAELRASENELLKRADIVFAASEELAARRRPLNSNIHVVENGVDYRLFASAQDVGTAVPVDLLRIAGPVIGCVATLTTFMNLTLLYEVFKRRPQWSLVFIGIDPTPTENARDEQRSLQELPNVHFMGRRPSQALPGYLKGCDVCVIPYAMEDAVLVCSSPLKLYEYLAAGKAVVSAPLPLMSHLEEVVAFAENADEWILAIEGALDGAGKGTTEERQRCAQENTWGQRVDFILHKLAAELESAGDA
jgi:glycosyltransferase involved in cell wall biosynthesis